MVKKSSTPFKATVFIQKKAPSSVFKTRRRNPVRASMGKPGNLDTRGRQLSRQKPATCTRRKGTRSERSIGRSSVDARPGSPQSGVVELWELLQRACPVRPRNLPPRLPPHPTSTTVVANAARCRSSCSLAGFGTHASGTTGIVAHRSLAVDEAWVRHRAEELETEERALILEAVPVVENAVDAQPLIAVVDVCDRLRV